MPADVFSLNSGWTGFYEYLGKRQTATITVTAFNATTSRVNVTLLEQSGVQIKLSGELLSLCLKISGATNLLLLLFFKVVTFYTTHFISTLKSMHNTTT